MKRFFQQQSGATIIEFAVVAPVIFLLLMGLIEFGRIGFTQVAIESATASAARQASIGRAISGDRVQYVREAIRTKLAGALDVDQLVITSNVVAGSITEIQVSYPWPARMPFMRQFIGTDGTMMLTASAIVKNEAF
jgi:Flp pilus assembly protein TadG